MEQKTEMPLVSVVLANYNNSQFLGETIESILNQTYRNLELIIVDDGSTDQSVEVIKSYKDSRIRLLELPENRQVCLATNEGLELVRGKYVARDDSDDPWKPEKLEKQIAYLEAHPECECCFTLIDIIDEKGQDSHIRQEGIYRLFDQKNRTREEWIRTLFFDGNCLCHGAAVYTASLIRKIGGYHAAYRQLHDYELWCRMIARTQFYIIPERLMSVRRRENSLSAPTRKNEIRRFNEDVMIRKMFLDQLCPELFIKSFGSMFRNPKAETETELECEKAFLLCRPFGNSEGFPWLGIEKLGQLIDQTETREILEKTYGFTAKDYYRLATEKCFDDTFLAGMYAVGNLYFDFGAGFGNEGRRDIRGNFSDGVLRFEQEAELPDGVKAVRFDPIEGNYCRVYGCEISCGEESLEWYAENAVKVGDSWFFGDVDPKIIIPVNPSVKVVHIKAECQIFRQDDLGIAELFQVVNESVRDKQMVEAQREHIKSLMWIKNIEDEI